MNANINTIYTKKYQPFIKWVGGKRGLLKQLMDKFPESFENYHEPFLGGGAVFFELYSRGLLEGKKVFLSDINAELVNAYNVVKSQPNELLKNLENFKENHNKEFYYEIRALDREEDFKNISNLKRATRFIYLNKTCFNGLYRVNKKGYFNTPIGSYKNPNIADRDTILSASKALQNVVISNQPFNEVVKNANKNDLIYFDPPYYPLTETASFTAYNENDFLDAKQKELFDVFEKLDKKKCYVLHSNSDTAFIKNLYQGHDINFVQANRFINSKSTNRGKINEVLIRNNMNKNKKYFDLSVDEKKEIFTKNLVATNRGFNFYVDWENAQAYKDFEIELNALNTLINVDNDKFKFKFQALLVKLPSVIKAFPLLFALSKKERENIWKGKDILHILEDVNLDKNALEYDFNCETKLSSEDIEKYYELFEKIGLKFLFQNLLEKNVLDYVIGVLVGLDSNGRKNRGGKSFELACEPIIKRLCEKYNIELLIQKPFKFLNEKYEMIIDDNIANRKADFILKKDNKVINIEANFYFDSGSKPEEIIDSYANRQYELNQNNIEFIYLTDGIKCWGNADKNQLTKGFKSINYIINFYMLKEYYFASIIKKIFQIK